MRKFLTLIAMIFISFSCSKNNRESKNIEKDNFSVFQKKSLPEQIQTFKEEADWETIARLNVEIIDKFV